MWIGVRQRFGRFHGNLNLTTDQLEDGLTKQLGVRQSLHRAYYNQSTERPAGFIVGSWAKGTQTRPPQDVDLFFELPVDEFQRFERYTGNKQSALLQEVKNNLLATYPQTSMRGDGQVVVVGFNTIVIEVVPVFRYDSIGRFYMPDTNAGGRWKLVDPLAEIALLDAADTASRNNARVMAKMLKTWKRECNVPLKSYQIELLAADFMSRYAYREYGYFWYDWFVRDFFYYLCGRSWMNLWVPGVGEMVNLGDAWH